MKPRDLQILAEPLFDQEGNPRIMFAGEAFDPHLFHARSHEEWKERGGESGSIDTERVKIDD